MIRNYNFLVSCVLCVVYVQCYIVNPGPKVVASKGAVWPRPQQQYFSDNYFVIRPRTFKFVLTNDSSNCNLLQNGLERYWKILQQDTIRVDQTLMYQSHDKHKKKWLSDPTFLGYLDELAVNLSGSCINDEYPSLNMTEKYNLTVTLDDVKLNSESIWGILRGLETFSQLVYLGTDGISLRVNNSDIKDYPRFKHRGLLLDTARHFIPLKQIYETLDALSYNKMNVFHWHIVDDQSFPYVSTAFPELSIFGAYDPHILIYTPEDVQNVIEYARVRGIRVIPEFDTPGHTRSWGVSHPELLTPCIEPGQYGPLDPSKNETYSFINALFNDVRQTFKDEFIHLGGDEVDFECWAISNSIHNFMLKHNITTFEGVESYYIQKIIGIADDLKFKSMVWEEVFNNGVSLPKETIVHVWQVGWTDTMTQVTLSGHHGILSTCWYLDHMARGGDWEQFYGCDPHDFNATTTQKELVIGGEACMWGESVNQYNVINRVWPRASAAAEKLWSAPSAPSDIEDPERRLEEHTCRMIRRGIAAQPPNAAGFCD